VAGFRFDSFKGIRPRVNARLLPQGEAQVAQNARLGSGSLEPWRDTTAVEETCSPDALSIFQMRNNGSPIWLQSTNDVDYARGPVQDDTLERIYYTGESEPRMTYIGLVEDDNGCPPGAGFRELGVPAPTTAPDVESDTSIVNPSSGGKFVALAGSGSTNRVMTSENGIDWEIQATPDRSLRDAAWSPTLSLWVAVGAGNGGVGDVLTSPDGEIWTERSTGIADVILWEGAVWASGLGLFVVAGGTQSVGGDGGRVATSPDGITWTERTAEGGTPLSTWLGLDYDEENDLLVAVGANTAAYSDDGISWTIVAGIADEIWTEVVYAPALDLWVAVGSQQTTSPIATSSDGGQNWTSRTSDGSTSFSSVEWSEELGLFVAVGLNGAVETSPDGINWTARTATAANDWFGVIWAPALGIFAAVSRDGTNDRVMTSTDGITWLAQVEAAAIQWFGIAFGTTAGTEATLDFDPRIYVYTFVTGLGEEGPPSPPSAIVNVTENAEVTIDNFATPPALPEYNITHIRIYRSAVGTDTEEFQFVAEILVATGTYDDTLADSELGEVLQTESWEPPPEGLRGIIALPNGAMAGFVGKTVHFSEPYFPHAWPPEYKQAVAHDIVGLGVLPNGVATLTKGTPYAIVGDHPRDMSQTHYQFSQACVSKRSIVNTINSVIYASPDGLCEIGTGGFKVLTRPYATKREWQEYNPTTMKGFWHDNTYFGFYDEGGIVFDPYDQSIGLTTTGTITVGGYVEPEDDALYLVTDVRESVIAAVAEDASGQDAMYSLDGISNWTLADLGQNNDWHNVVWIGADINLFFACKSAAGGSQEYSTSPDGINWTPRDNTLVNYVHHVAYSPELGLIVAAGSGGGNASIATSTDGINWTNHNWSQSATATTAVWAADLELFFAVSQAGAVFSSPDGSAWTLIGPSVFPVADSKNSNILWNPALGLLVYQDPSGIYTSPDGASWDQVLTLGNIESVTYSPDLDLMVAVGGSGLVRTSSDGTTWTSQTASINNSWHAVTWSPELELFIAVGQTGTSNTLIMTSPDGETWTTRTSPADQLWRGVAAGAPLVRFITSWDTGLTNMLTTWKSGKLVAPYPMNLGAGRIVADSYPVTLSVWNDEGDQVVSKEVTGNETFRLPGGYLSDWFELQVSNDDVVAMLHVAETVEELLQG
jgi:hypothetical protein